MTHRSRYAAALAPLFCATLFVAATDSFAQAAPGLAGAWTMVTNVTTDAAGKKEASYGEKPMGQVVFSPNGRYTLFI